MPVAAVVAAVVCSVAPGWAAPAAVGVAAVAAAAAVEHGGADQHPAGRVLGRELQGSVVTLNWVKNKNITLSFHTKT